MSNAIDFQEVSKLYRLGRARRSLREFLANLAPGRREASAQTLWALRDVSLEIKTGEAVAIIGANGAGKSTLLKLIGNIVAPTRGQVTVRGRVASLLEMGAGFHPDLSGRENVFLNGAILGMKRGEIRSSFDSIVDFAELHQFIDTPVKRYSSGMYTRLAFAVAVHVNPDILLVDEVLAVGDKAFQEKSLSRARELQSEARTIVFVSHNMYTVQALCQRGVFLNHGRIEFVGPIREAVRRYEDDLLTSRPPPTKGAARQPGREWHSNGVRISDVGVRDPQGEVLEQCGLGEPFAIHLGYHAERRVEWPIFGVYIHRADGVVCAAASTRFDDFDVPAIEGGGRLQVRFDPVLLGPGIYTIDAHIYDRSHRYAYASWEQAASFRIQSAVDGLIDSEGIYHLPHRWSSV